MRSAALAPLCLAMGGCFDDVTVLYSHDFSAGGGGWSTARTLLTPDQVPEDAQVCWVSWLSLMACNIDAPVVDGRMTLQSPWWLDANHAPPGAGFLALMAWVYLDGEPGSSTAGLDSLDLRGATLRISMRARDLQTEGGHLMFWFQTPMPDGRLANYLYSGQPLETLLPDNGSLGHIRVHLASDDDSWTCLGSAANRMDTYGCMPVLDALASVSLDFGLVLFPASESPLPEAQPSGVIEVQSFEVVRL